MKIDLPFVAIAAALVLVAQLLVRANAPWYSMLAFGIASFFAGFLWSARSSKE